MTSRPQNKTFGLLRLLVLSGVILGAIAILVLGEVRKYQDRDAVMTKIREEGGSVVLGEPTQERSPWQLRYWLQPFVEDNHISAVRIVHYHLRNQEDLSRLFALEEMSHLTLVGELNTDLVNELKKLPMLETLTLASTTMDTNVLNGLENHPTLKQLTLSNCNLTVAVLRALAELPLDLSLYLDDPSLTDEVLVALSKCENLRRLQLDRCDIDNKRLQLLQGSSTSTLLVLNGTQVTTNGIVALHSANKGWTIELENIDAPRRDSTPPNQFPSSESIGTQTRLDFAGPSIDDSLFDCIASAKNLQILGLTNCSITDDGFARLLTFSKLQQLHLASKHLTDEGIKTANHFSVLEYLYLHANSMRGEGFANLPASIKTLTLRTPLVSPTALNKLAHLKSLQELTLEGNNFTDLSLESLPPSLSLKQLTLYETAVTEQGVASFKIRSPGCIITRD